MIFLVSAEGAAQPLDGAAQAALSGAARSIRHALGLREPQLIEQLSDSLKGAAADARASLLLWRRMGELGADQLLSVRPAREPGYAIVSVQPLDAPPASLTSELIAQIFGVSPSEADIALALLKDESVAEISRRRGVQIETVRGQIKTLLRKLDLGSQKQLVRVLTRVAAAAA